MQKKRLASLTVLVFLTATIFLFQNCGAGTDTGNPMNPRAPNQEQITFSGTAASLICEKVVACHPSADIVACKIAVKQISGLPQRLGAPATWTTLAASHQAEVDGMLVGDMDNATACGAEVDAIVCASSEATNAYQPGQAQPFAAADALVPLGGSCPTTFP